MRDETKNERSTDSALSQLHKPTLTRRRRLAVASFNSEAALGRVKVVGRECSAYLTSHFDLEDKRTSTSPGSAVGVIDCGSASAGAHRSVEAKEDGFCGFPEPRQQVKCGEERSDARRSDGLVLSRRAWKFDHGISTFSVNTFVQRAFASVSLSSHLSMPN